MDIPLWLGKFNYQGEMWQDYTRAKTQRQAEELLFRRFAAEKRLSSPRISAYFRNKANSFEVREII
jgi:hypothetical protein